MLAGMGGMAAGMFPGIGERNVGPTPEQMEEARQKVMFSKTVNLLGIHAKIFDLGDSQQLKEYEELLTSVIKRQQEKLSFLMVFEKQFVPQQAKWLAYVQWADFELKVTANPTIGDADEEASTVEH